MSKEMMELIKEIAELGLILGEKKGKLEALEKENEFLRGLLKDKIAERM